MAKRLGIGFVTWCSPVIVFCFFFDHLATQWLFSVLAVSFPFALIALGSSKRNSVGRLALPLTVLVVASVTTMLGMLLLRGTNHQAWFGFPSSAYLLLLGLWLVPFLIVSWAYAATFSEMGIDDTVVHQMDERRRVHARTKRD